MISRGYSLNLMLLFLLLYLNLTAAATSIAGKVLCAQSGLPLDGVRVASTAGKNSTMTGSDGHFSLATAGMPESTTVSSFYEYSMNVLSSGKREKFITDEVTALSFSLFDLKGRVIEHTVCRNADLRFPQKKLLSGMYLLQVTGFKPERILITGRSMQGIVYKRRHPEIVFSKPDTIYFCKDGYRPYAASLREINGGASITLREKRWVAVDIHNHTVLTDGSYIQDSLLQHAFGEGRLDVYANSEHGGMAGLDTAGMPITGDAVPRGIDGFSVPRWYTLANYSWPKLLGQRTVYPGKILIEDNRLQHAFGEGRHLWIIMNSDFHYTYKDFWPGEYAKTWTSVTDTGAQEWLEGMRSGEIFITTGDLLSHLEFSIDDGIFDAPMGADLFSRSREPTVIIRFKETPVNNHGDTNHVDHIDLIAGRITGKKDPSNPVSYADLANPSTQIQRRFTSSDWITDNGWLVIRTEIPCTQPMFYRLRGTNLAIGEPGEVDAEGNPLMDQAGANNEEAARKDLWFYSDPIFVYPSW
jgi:hypothetical protein